MAVTAPAAVSTGGDKGPQPKWRPLEDERWLAAVLLLPTIVLLGLFIAYPFVRGILLSVSDSRVGVPGEFVAGVRFRAWQPPSALHPTITVDGPLRFELVDMATGTSRGGCTYHVSHPGGRSYDTPPVNAVEAESRRGRRFEATGFTPGRVDTSDIREKQARQSTDVGAPGILDLRRVRTVLH